MAVVYHRGNTGADNERRVDQADQQEHLGLQRIHQFRLTRGRLEEAATHDADADTCASSAEADDKTGGKSDKTNHLFHDNSFSNRFEVVEIESGN